MYTNINITKYHYNQNNTNRTRNINRKEHPSEKLQQYTSLLKVN